MELDLITARTKEELEKKLEEKKAEGWESYGESGIIDPKLESNFTDIPHFIYYWRHVVKT